MLKREELLKMFESAGAVRHGHFELSSGLHSGTYVQCALVLQYPKYAEQCGRALAAEFTDLRVDCVASPALGGVITHLTRPTDSFQPSNVTWAWIDPLQPRWRRIKAPVRWPR